MDKLFNAKGYSRNKLGEGVSQAGSLLKFFGGKGGWRCISILGGGGIQRNFDLGGCRSTGLYFD